MCVNNVQITVTYYNFTHERQAGTGGFFSYSRLKQPTTFGCLVVKVNVMIPHGLICLLADINAHIAATGHIVTGRRVRIVHHGAQTQILRASIAWSSKRTTSLRQ